MQASEIVLAEKTLQELITNMRILCQQSETALQSLSRATRQEQEYRQKRQMEGIKAAKARGVHIGRKPVPAPENFGELVGRWEQGNLDFAGILKETGLKESTFYRRLREYRKKSLG